MFYATWRPHFYCCASYYTLFLFISILSTISCVLLSKPAGDVILRPLVFGFRKYYFRVIILNDGTGAPVIGQHHHGSVIRYARGLLHVMCDDHNGISLLEFLHQLFDLKG